MRYAIIDSITFIVQNVIIYDGVSPWALPDGTFIIATTLGDIADTYDINSQTFIKPT